MALLKLLGLCLAMFFGAYLCGEIPLRCPMSKKRMRYLTTLGVGLLIGVSFIVIIPEGVHTYYGAKAPPTPALNATIANGRRAHDHSHEKNNYGHQNAHLATDHEDTGSDHDHSGHDEHGDHDHSSGGHSHQECVDLGRSSSSVGLALVAGFVVMFLVDRLGGAEEGHAHSHGGGDSPVHEHDDEHSHLLEHPHAHHGPTPTQHIHVAPSAAGNHEHRRSDSPVSLSPASASSAMSASPSTGNIDECKQLRINPLSPRASELDLQPLRQ
jgi:hypothetical protein